MTDNLALLKNFVIGMGILIFLGFVILLLSLTSKIIKAKDPCPEHNISLSGEITDIYPVSQKSFAVISENDIVKKLTVYDYCSGEAIRQLNLMVKNN